MSSKLLRLSFCAAALLCVRAGADLQEAGAGAEPGRPLRVVTYNIHHGEGVDAKLDLARIAGVITAQKPDLVAVQEVDVRTRRTSSVDQAAGLAKLTGMHVAFGRTIDYQGGQYGNAVLSRFPVEKIETHSLPGEEPAERRGALAVTVRPWGRDEGVVTFVATHFDHQREPDRIRQVKEINRLFVKDDGAPVILAGDLNAVPDSEPMRVLLKEWTDAGGANGAATVPADKPRRRIDYVLLRPSSGWRVVETLVVEEPLASDHRPLLAVVEWKQPRTP